MITYFGHTVILQNTAGPIFTQNFDSRSVRHTVGVLFIQNTSNTEMEIIYMIIVIKNGHENIIDEIKSRFTETNEVFVHNNRVAIQGISEEDLNAEEKNATDLIIDNVPAAVQGSRLFHPEDTIVTTAHSQIGGDNFTMMAGPCSVESADHVMRMAEVAKSGGATVLRGGAFKPRTSPYSFQGLGEDGLKFLRAAADAYDMDVLTEVMDQDHVPMVEQYTDIFPNWCSKHANFSLLKAVGKLRLQ